MKKPVLNPNHVPLWDEMQSYDYLAESYRSYVSTEFYGWDLRKDYDAINSLYREGRVRQILSCDYVSFVDTMVRGVGYPLSPLYKSRPRSRWGRYPKPPHRQKQKYLKNNGKSHAKKVLTSEESGRREWRKEKRVRLDKSKSSWSQSNLGPAKWVKRYSNKINRLHEKIKIRNGDWGDLGDSDYKCFLDARCWD